MTNIPTLGRLIEASAFTLTLLSDITSRDFAHGADAPARERLAKALGYEDFEDWREHHPT